MKPSNLPPPPSGLKPPGQLGLQPPGSSPMFFVDYKKGEVNQLKNMLHSVNLNNDKTKKKEVIKKAIAYMTLGLDVSRLYPEMVKASITTDIAQKKMVYHFLTHYAKQNQEHSVMATNTFHKDCIRKDNPRIHGLALRHLCEFNFSGSQSYLAPAIVAGLSDPDAYVRRIAIIGCRKFYDASPANFKSQDLTKRLYQLTQDSHALVVTNALQVLDQIQEDGIKFNENMITMLLTRIKQFNQFGQGIILDIVSRYKPKTKEQTLQIMNVLQERFKNASAVVVLGTVKIFLNYAKIMKDIASQIYARLANPLIILMSGGQSNSNNQQVYVVLSHIKLLAVGGTGRAFQEHFKIFFCNDSDPGYIKNLKLEMLVVLANESNLQAIVDQLGHYVIDVDVDLARMAISSIGKIAIRLPGMSRPICYHLRTFLSHGIDYITAETVITLKDVLRKYPDFITEFANSIQLCVQTVQQPSGKSAIIWILGQFGGQDSEGTMHIEKAPYFLQDIYQSFAQFDSDSLANDMLTATMKLFFKRPAETIPLLRRVIGDYTKPNVNVDTHDKAVFYYRLLKQDVELAKKVVIQQANEHNSLKYFYQDRNEDLYQKLFTQYNSISITQMQPEEKFIRKEFIKEKRNDFRGLYQPLGGGDDEDDDDDNEDQNENNKYEEEDQNKKQDLLGMNEVASNQVDLLANDSEPSLLNPIDSTNTQQQTGSIIGDLSSALGLPSQNVIQLDPNGKIDPSTFESLWKSLPQAVNETYQLMIPVTSLKQADEKFGANRMPSLATQEAGNDFRFFLSAITLDKKWFLCETFTHENGSKITLKLKAQDGNKVPAFVSHFKGVIGAM